MASLNQSNFQTVWSDNFTNDSSLNTGIFPIHWGNSSEYSFGGGLTLKSDGTFVGFLTHDSGAWDSTGYGLYQATLSVPSNGQAPGIAVLMWPATNNWPGPEIDLAEQLNGKAYMTVHWAGSGNSNDYKSYFLNNVDLTHKTTFAADWERGSLTFYVNGQQVVQYTSGGSVPIPKDAADGGQNEAFGAQVATKGDQVTLYNMSYSKYTGSGGSSSGSSPITSSTTTGSGGASFATSGNPGSSSGQTLYASKGTDILLGGSGADRFYVDAANSDGWAEIDNMHSGDVVNILGFRQGQSTITWTTSTDPAGHSGATANISLNGNGHTDTAITFTGVSVGAAKSFSSGEWHTSSGTPYLSLWKV